MARLFDDANTQYLENVSALAQRPITFACWFKADAAIDGTLFGSTDSTVAAAFKGQAMTYMGASNAGAIRVAEQGSTAYGAVVSSAGVAAGNWAHAACVFISRTSRSAYLNGTNKATNTTDTGATVSSTRVDIGAHYYNKALTAYFSGVIAEVGVWLAALTDAEIALLALGYSPLLVRPASLQNYWPLIGRYSPEIDLGNSAAMTLSASAPVVADHPRVLYPSRLARR